MTHKQLKDKALQKKSVKLEYDKLESEFASLQQVLSSKQASDASQSDPINPFQKWAGKLGGMKTVEDVVNWQREVRGES